MVDSDERKGIELYKSGLSIRQAAAEVGLSYGRLQRVLVENRIPRRIGAPTELIGSGPTKVVFFRELEEWDARFRAVCGPSFANWARTLLRAECERLERIKS